MRWCGVALAAAAAGACGGARPATAAYVPERAATAGDRLLARVPAGAEVVLELNLARLRANPVVGATLTDALRAGPVVPGAPAGLAGPLADAATVVLAAYRVGTPEAATITVVAGGARPALGLNLGDGVWALAPEGETAALVAAAAGGPSVATDTTLLATRAWAMPAAATGASVRLAARLDDTGRVALAGALGLDAAPAAVSVWGDVADDLALVARLADTPPAPRPPWLAGLGRLLQRVATSEAIAAIGLSRPVADAEIRRDGGAVRVAMVVGPARLARVARRLRDHQGASSP